MAAEVHTLSHGSRNIPTNGNVDATKPPTFFSKADIQYMPLSEDGDVELAGFLNACKGIVEFIAFLGKSFSPVKQDISGNISKVDRVYQTDTQRYATVKKLLDAEIIDWPNRMGPATEALLWLKRSLEFVCIFLDLLVVDFESGVKSHSLAAIAKEAYKRSLKQYHKAVERGLFKVILCATPSRKDFLKTISAGRTNAEDECIADIAGYLESMKPNVDSLVVMYKDLGFDK